MSEESPILEFPHYFAVRKETDLRGYFLCSPRDSCCCLVRICTSRDIVGVRGRGKYNLDGTLVCICDDELRSGDWCVKKRDRSCDKQAVANYFAWTLVIGLAFLLC